MGERRLGPIHIDVNQHTAVALAIATGAGFAAGYLFTASLSSRPKADIKPAPPAIRTPRYTEESESEPGTPRSVVSEDPGYLKLVLIVNLGAEMGPGQTAVQCAHAAIAQFKKLLKRKDPVLHRWERNGGPKVCVSVDSEEEMLELRSRAQARGIPTFAVEDPRSDGVKSVVAIGPAPGGSIDSIVGHLQLLGTHRMTM